MKLRAGVAGAGAMGRNHARVFSLLEDVELAAIYDQNKEQAEKVAAEFEALQTEEGRVSQLSGYQEIINRLGTQNAPAEVARYIYNTFKSSLSSWAAPLIPTAETLPSRSIRKDLGMPVTP